MDTQRKTTGMQKLLRAVHIAVWLLLLGLINLIDFEVIEPALVVILTAILTLAAAPVSLILVGILSAIPDGWSELVLGSRITLENFTKVHALIWWALLFALSYWQWFYLLPYSLKVVRRWRGS